MLLIGAGTIAQRVHLPRLAADSPPGRLYIQDSDPVLAREQAHRFGAVVYEGPVVGAEADVVWICTPAASHAALVAETIQAGKRVVVEKPLSLSWATARTFLQSAESGRGLIKVCHTPSWRRDVQALLDLVHRRKIGSLRHVSLSWRRTRGVPSSPGAISAGLLWDLGPHLTHVLAGLVGAGLPGQVDATAEPPRDISRLRAAWYTDVGVRRTQEDVIAGLAATVRFDNDVSADFEIAWDAPVERDAVQIVLVGSRGTATLRGLFGLSPVRASLAGPALVVGMLDGSQPRVLIEAPLIAPVEFDAQHRELSAARPADTSALSLAVEAVRLCDAIGRSLDTASTVRL